MEKYLKIENAGYMPLVIEHIGSGPRGLPLICVAHTDVQNGDLMYDPEMTFEVDPQNPREWGPITYRQDNLGINQEAVWRDESGRVMVNLRLVRDLKKFARIWDRYLCEQGFLEAAHKQSQGG